MNTICLTCFLKETLDRISSRDGPRPGDICQCDAGMHSEAVVAAGLGLRSWSVGCAGASSLQGLHPDLPTASSHLELVSLEARKSTSEREHEDSMAKLYEFFLKDEID